ncbi:glycosyltransferase [Cellulomonas sp. zg-ZUI222]|uniref:glycosyltransferase family 4 protein n=1 Tax=Cellulomonas wangleii TaxID=2816956 RepID=UPI001A94E3CB|nr:glycosyltransferase family 4 protein [Cellulomonas wangleii]MBO0922492.1 glycosyltransferase [Cellulomonas wangleii]
MRGFARQVALGVTTATGMAAEDPALLAVQASRRAPRRVTLAVAGLLDNGTGGRHADARRGLAAWLRGHRDDARAGVAAALAGRPASPVRRVLGEVAVELDVPLPPDAPRVTRARAAWRAGDVSGAVALAQGTPLGRRLASEQRAMTPGTVLAGDRRARSTPAGPPVALHLLTNSLPHTSSGYTLRSHEVLRAQAAAGIEVAAATRLGYPVVVGRVTGRDVDVVDGIAYHRLLPWSAARTPGARLRQNVALARPLVRALRPTVLHTTTAWSNAVVTRALADEHGLPWVYEVRGVLEDTWAASFPTAEAQHAARASERHALVRARETELARAADHVVTLGETVRRDLVTRGVDPARITVVPNAVPGELLDLHVSSTAARARLGLSGEGFWVGTVSSLVDYEGIETLVEAVAVLRRRGADVRCAVVGDGTARASIARRAQTLGIADHVVLPGRVAPDEAVGWHLALDAFAVPRRDTAVTRAVVPLKPMQAMALGRPVVASDLPALAEIVGEPGTGLLAAPDDAQALADAIERLADDRALAGSLGEAGRAFAATRTWAAAGRGYRSLYEEVTA